MGATVYSVNRTMNDDDGSDSSCASTVVCKDCDSKGSDARPPMDPAHPRYVLILDMTICTKKWRFVANKMMNFAFKSSHPPSPPQPDNVIAPPMV